MNEENGRCLEQESTAEAPEIVALPVWLGMRVYDEDDFDEFHRLMCYQRSFASYQIQLLSEVELRREYGKTWLSGVREMNKRINSIISKAENRVAVFFIITGGIAESKWFPVLRKLVFKNFPASPIYTIVVGGELKSKWRDRDRRNPYSPDEIRAHELDSVVSYFDSDAPTAGMHRLMELLNRTMGADLPGQKFPDYSPADFRRLAWHVSRENFNMLGVRAGSIPKYEIGPDGKPVFDVRFF